jgi:hypothetical protein
LHRCVTTSIYGPRACSYKDVPIRRFIEGESRELPKFYENRVRENLGPLWEALPEGALMHDQNAYLRSRGETPPDRHRELRWRAAE